MEDSCCYGLGMSKLTIVSNRLPVSLSPEGVATRTAGGLSSAIEGAGLSEDYTWIGWGGIGEELIEDVGAHRAAVEAVGFSPVMLSSELIGGYYEGYSNGTLWPILHYMTERARFEANWPDAYREVNRKFADEIARKAEPDSRVWVHDYQLFLVPSMLRALRPDLRIGFFLHTPFPSSEIFRVLPERMEILEGLLGCDLIGFHTFNYLRHFRSSVLRILGLEAETDGLWHDDRFVRFGVFPIGHNRSGFHAAMNGEGFRDALALFGGQLGEGRLVLNVERLDYTKGVPQKLAAIRLFLRNHPELRRNTNFVLIAVPSRQGVVEYDRLTEEVQREVGAINGEFGEVGHAPVQFLHRGFSLEELAALYALADVCMVTPIIDGMNLVAKEYIDCKRENLGARPGCLILSEFAGAAQEMSHALLINPHDTPGVARALEQALLMPDHEKRNRVDAMQDRLARNDASAWSRRFLEELDRRHTMEITSEPGSFHDLLGSVNEALAAGKKLAVFLDYDGTLRAFVDRPMDAVPDAGLLPLLGALGSHPQVDLAVVSGRPAEFLETHLGNAPIDLVAEHGYRWRPRGTAEWSLLDPRVDTAWMEEVLPHLEAAVTLTPGTEIEVKRSSIVWHYRRADPEFGVWRAMSLLSELTSVTASLPVSVHHGQKIVEVSSLLVNKGAAVDHLMRLHQPSLALAAGDDQTDETMFALRPEGIDAFHAIKIGAGSTRAQHRTTIDGLRHFLETLARDLPRITP